MSHGSALFERGFGRPRFRIGVVVALALALTKGAPIDLATAVPFLLATIRPELGKRTEALEDLAVEMYARGLSTYDIEAALYNDQGR